MNPLTPKTVPRTTAKLQNPGAGGFLVLLLLGLVTSVESLTASGDNPPRPETLPTVSVKDFGAKGDGVADDRPAVQAAIDSLTNGGTVSFPAGTYLMDSSIRAKSGDNFNLVTSHDNLTFEPAPGAPAGSVKLIQGPNGWGAHGRRVFGPLAVFNSEFFMESPIGQNGYQNIHQNGGYYTLNSPILSNNQSVTFATAAEASKFVRGDWIAVSETTDQQRIEPLEINQVVSVDAHTGVVALRWPQIQDYPTGFAAKVTHMVRSNITIRGLTMQGVVLNFWNDVYNLEVSDCKMICDVTYSAPQRGNYIFSNGVRHVLFKDNVISDYPESSVGYVNGAAYPQNRFELPQNNSIDVTIEHNTFLGSVLPGVGEYPAHWVIKDNYFQLFPAPSGKKYGVTIQGYDMLFEGNILMSTAPVDYLFADFTTAPNHYKWLFGAIKIRNNCFSSAMGMNAVRVYSPDTEFSGNLVISGPGQHAFALTVAGGPPRNIPKSEVKASNVITNNTFHGQGTTGSGCVQLSGASLDGIAFHNNTVIGHDSRGYGVWVQNDANDEGHRTPALDGNHLEGFKTPVFYAPKHP